MSDLEEKTTKTIVKLALKTVWETKLGSFLIRTGEIKVTAEDIESLEKTIRENIVLIETKNLYLIPMGFLLPQIADYRLETFCFLTLTDQDFKIIVFDEMNLTKRIGIVLRENRAKNSLVFWIKDLQNPKQVAKIRDEIDQIIQLITKRG